MARHQAIILKKIPIREDDELVMCYTKDFGKQRYQAKSSVLARSKQGGHLDILNLVEFSLVEGKHRDIIASAAASATFPRLKSSLPALAAAFFLLECFDKLVFENDHDQKLWQFLLDELHQLDAGVVELPELQKRFLSVMGHDASTAVQELAQRRFSSFQFSSTIK
ncbi:MAG: DNA repair protein RecO [Patescibacteria group bacterium]